MIEGGSGIIDGQVSLEPAEGRLLGLLRELFPGDAKLRQEQADWREAQR